jgi:hypothetical protein
MTLGCRAVVMVCAQGWLCGTHLLPSHKQAACSHHSYVTCKECNICGLDSRAAVCTMLRSSYSTPSHLRKQHFSRTGHSNYHKRLNTARIHHRTAFAGTHTPSGHIPFPSPSPTHCSRQGRCWALNANSCAAGHDFGSSSV